jgi:hypothetical protein
MKKLVVGCVLLLVVGCGKYVNIPEINKAAEICKDKGGVFRIDTGDKSVQCYDLTWTAIRG